MKYNNYLSFYFTPDVLVFELSFISSFFFVIILGTISENGLFNISVFITFGG